MATILRLSKYVRNFAEFATKIGFRHIKVDAHVNLLSQRHSAPCSVFARSLATQVAVERKDTESNLEIILRKLDFDVKRNGRITKSKLQRMLDVFEDSESVTSTQALMVIRCCGNLIFDELPEFRSKLVNQVWKSLENSGTQLDLSHYNALLRVYVENEYAFSPTEILAELERKGIEPNKITYQRLISRYCQQGDIEGASKILEFMREKGMSVNENIFTALVRGHSEANDMASAADILSVMRQAGLDPSADTYKELLCGYAKHGDTQSITNTLTECKSKGIHLLDMDYLDVIHSLACNGHGAHVEMILSILPKEVGFLQDALCHVLKLVHAGQMDIALQVLSSIPNRDGGYTGHSVIKQLSKADLPVETLVDWCKLIESKGINSRALLIALESNLLEGEIDRSLVILRALKESGAEIRDHYFWPIFVALGRSKNNAGINDLLRSMQTQYNQHITVETLRDYVIPNMTGEPDQILSELVLAGIPAGTSAYTIVYNLILQMKIKEAADFVPDQEFHYNLLTICQPLVTALAHTNDVESFVAILLHIGQSRLIGRTRTNQGFVAHDNILDPYIIAVADYIKKDNCEILTKVLEQLLLAGCSISNECIATIQQLTGRRSTPELCKLLDRFKNNIRLGTSDPLHIHREISRLEKTMHNTINDKESSMELKKRFLFLYSSIKDLPNLEKTIAELKEQGYELTPTMHKIILDAYLNSDVLDKSEEYIAILQQMNPNYLCNDKHVIKYTVLLVKNDRIEDALKFLQKQQSIQIRDYKNSRNMWQRLLDAVAETGSNEAVNVIFDMLSRNGYIKISTAILGPLVKVHIIRDDLTKALSVFENICETYNCTPSKAILAKKLILAEDAASLQHLTDLNTQIHGESNSLYELVFYFIECDCLRQAKKILQIPALHAKSHRLVLGAQRYMEHGMAVYLERLISVIKDMPPYNTMPEYYENLIRCYDKNNNWEKGLNLLKQMEEDEIEPSEVFLRVLADLLIRNYQPVPFVERKLQHRQNIAKFTESQPLRPARNSSNHQIHKIGDVSEYHNSNDDPMKRDVRRAKYESSLIKSMLRNGDLHSAFEITENLLEKNVYPEHSIFKSLIKRAGEAGQIEFLEKLGKNLSPNMKKSVGHENNVCRAYIEVGKVEEYLDKLEQRAGAVSELDSNTLSSELPTGVVRKCLQEHPEFLEKFTKIAEKFAAQGVISLMYSLWIHHFINGHPDADRIWSEHLAEQPRVLVGTIVRVAQQQNNPELLKKLVKTLGTAPKINSEVIGLVYSELIELSYLCGNFQESVDILREALKVVSIHDLGEYKLAQMKTYLLAKGQALPTDIFPESEVTEAKERLTT